MLRVLRRGQKPHRPRSGWWHDFGGLVEVGVVVLVVSTFLVIRARRHVDHLPEPSTATAALPATLDTKWNETWPRFDITGFPARPLEEIRAAYAFAVRRPDVLQSMPCYCGCKRHGHQSNEACYVKSRSSTGVPLWTDHAVTCGICIDITHDAIVMTVDGKPIDEMRRAIEMKYQEH